MNFREGMRRLALLTGGLGALLGAGASFLALRDALERRTRSKAFDSLAASAIVQQERQWISIHRPPAGYEPTSSDVNKRGIKTIHWGKNLTIESIDTEYGTLYNTSAPSPWMYLSAVIWPVLGFLVPWGAIRAITWVVVGF
ncbi:MAG: hypothetical protein ACR2JB_06000 [Bryobacteraceae bacterium]